MEEYPNLSVIVLYTRNPEIDIPDWNGPGARYIKRIRSSHTRSDGGIVKSYYTVETPGREIMTLIYDHDQLLWNIKALDATEEHPVDFVLAHAKATAAVPSFDHRLIPYRFAVLQERPSSGVARTLTDRMQPYRFLRGKHSMQVTGIRCRHIEDLEFTHHLHYVVRTDQHRYFNLVYARDKLMWKFIQEVDVELFFDAPH